MSYLTRYYFKLNQVFNFIIKKLVKLKKNFLFFLIFLFFGFFSGNLFGTVVDSIRRLNIADGFLIFLLLLLNEFINFHVYNNSNRSRLKTIKIKKLNFLNPFKMGFLLGIFIDSFKVGS